MDGNVPDGAAAHANDGNVFNAFVAHALVVANVTVKLPEFYASRPDIWFTQLMLFFAQRKSPHRPQSMTTLWLRSQMMLLNKFLTSLDCTFSAICHMTLKAAILWCLSKPASKRMRQVSQFLCHIQSLISAEELHSDMFCFIFLQKMPEVIRPHLAVQHALPIENLVEQTYNLLTFHQA